MMTDYVPSQRLASGFGSTPIGPSVKVAGPTTTSSSGVGSPNVNTGPPSFQQPAPLGPLLYDKEVTVESIQEPPSLSDHIHDQVQEGDGDLKSGAMTRGHRNSVYKFVREITLVKSMTDHHPGVRIDHEHSGGVKSGPAITIIELPALINEEISLIESISSLGNIFLGTSSANKSSNSGNGETEKSETNGTTVNLSPNPSASPPLINPRHLFSLKGRTQSQTNIISAAALQKQQGVQGAGQDSDANIIPGGLPESSTEEVRTRLQRIKGWRKPKQTLGTNTSLMKSHVSTISASIKEHNLRGPDHPLLVTSFTRTLLVHAIHPALEDCIFWITFGIAPDGKDVQVTCHAVNMYTVSQTTGERIDVVVGTDQGDIVWLDLCSNKYERFNKKGSMRNGKITSLAWVPGYPNLFLAGFQDGVVLVFDVNSRVESGLGRFKRSSKEKSGSLNTDESVDFGSSQAAASPHFDKELLPTSTATSGRGPDEDKETESIEDTRDDVPSLTREPATISGTASPSMTRMSGWIWSKKFSKAAFGTTEVSATESGAPAAPDLTLSMMTQIDGVPGSMAFQRISQSSKLRREEGCAGSWMAAGGRAIRAFAFKPEQQMNTANKAETPSTMLAIGSDDGYIRLIDFDDQKVIYSIPSFFGRIRCLSFSPDGRYLVAGCTDDLIAIVSASDGRLMARCEGHGATVRSVAFDNANCRLPSRQYRIISVAEDRSISFWDFSSKGLNRHNVHHSNGIHSNSRNKSSPEHSTALEDGQSTLASMDKAATDDADEPVHSRDYQTGAVGNNDDRGKIRPRTNIFEVTNVTALTSTVIHTRPCVALQILHTWLITIDLMGHVKCWSKT